MFQVLKMIALFGIQVKINSSPVARKLSEVHEQAQVIGAGDGESNQVHAKPFEKKASGEKVGRNDDCPCGSGKKYKRCHGK